MIKEPEIAGEIFSFEANKQAKKKNRKISIGRRAKMDYLICIANVYA